MEGGREIALISLRFAQPAIGSSSAAHSCLSGTGLSKSGVSEYDQTGALDEDNNEIRAS
jgi:hypothetical protein